MEGDFNDITKNEEKNGGIKMQSSYFIPFNSFISDMKMGEVSFKGRTWTWANNRQGEAL